MENDGFDADVQMVGEAVVLTLTGPSWFLNVYASPEEWKRLPDVHRADWDERGTVRLGTTNGAPAWWSVTDCQVTISIGHDDETSDIVFSLPPSVLDLIDEALASIDVPDWRPGVVSRNPP